VLPFRVCSPEVFARAKFSPKSDVFALGVLAWELFTTGLLPLGTTADKDSVSAAVQRGERLQQFLVVFSHYLVRMNRGEAEHQFIELPTGVDYLQLSFVLKGQCSEVAREERAGDTPPLPVRGQD
jgi:hypothetical protein